MHYWRPRGGGGGVCRLLARGGGEGAVGLWLGGGGGGGVVGLWPGGGGGGRGAVGLWPGGGGVYLAEKREGEEPYIMWTGLQLPLVSAHAFVSSR